MTGRGWPPPGYHHSNDSACCAPRGLLPERGELPEAASADELVALAPSSPRLWVRAEVVTTILREQEAARESGQEASTTILPWPLPSLRTEFDVVLRVATEHGQVIYRLVQRPDDGIHGGLVLTSVATEGRSCYLAEWPD